MSFTFEFSFLCPEGQAMGCPAMGNSRFGAAGSAELLGSGVCGAYRLRSLRSPVPRFAGSGYPGYLRLLKRGKLAYQG